MRARRGKTVAQQCKYYEVENIYEYMVSVYINGNITPFGEMYSELGIDARKQFGIPNFIRTKGWESLLNCF